MHAEFDAMLSRHSHAQTVSQMGSIVRLFHRGVDGEGPSLDSLLSQFSDKM